MSNVANTAYTIESASKALRERTVSSEELTRECLVQIERHRRLNAFITVLADQALADARRADAEIRAGKCRGPLHGVPISVKDLFDIEGCRTTAGSLVRQQAVARKDAVAVARLKQVGAI